MIQRGRAAGRHVESTASDAGRINEYESVCRDNILRLRCDEKESDGRNQNQLQSVIATFESLEATDDGVGVVHVKRPSTGRPNGSDVQRRGQFRVPKSMLMLAPLDEARKRRAGVGPRPLLRRVGPWPLGISAAKRRYFTV